MRSILSFSKFTSWLLTFLIIQMFSLCAWALNPSQINDIKIEGLERVEPGTVFISLPIKVGDIYNDSKGSASIRALYGLGLFKDVRVELIKDILIVRVEEKPIIVEISFSGNKEFESDSLKKALKQFGLSEDRHFDKARLDQAEQGLKSQYISRSLNAVEIVSTVTPIEKNRVSINFSINEGEPTKISQLKIVGAKKFKEIELLDLMDLNEGGSMSWYTKSNQYDRTKLNSDLEKIRAFYLNQGYLDFQVKSTQVAITPDKKNISITINIFEGTPYRVKNVELVGNYLGLENSFKPLVKVKVGSLYNATDEAETKKIFLNYFSDIGYAFARVNVKPSLDRDKNLVTLLIEADPFMRVYVRKIIISGNNRTQDEVIRREFRQFESAWYDGKLIKTSRNRLDRLGFFKEVNIQNLPVIGINDQVDLEISVLEKPTGNISIGAGFSSGDGLGLMFGVNQDNVFGSGQSLGVDINTSKTNRNIAFNTTNPFFTENGVSRSYSIFHRTTKPSQDPDSYKIIATGANVTFGIPISEVDRIFLGIGGNRNTIIKGSYLPESYINADMETTSIPITFGWTRDDRDSLLAPTEGRLLRVNGEWSVAGDARYILSTYKFQQYRPLSRKITSALNIDLGLGAGVSGSTYPVYKNLFAGGLGSVRGFQQGSLGPRDSKGVAEGGTRKYNINAEVIAPFPGVGNDRTLRVFGFVDAGGAGGPNGSSEDKEVRVSSGVGLSWISPVGPLSLVFARGIRKFDGDKLQSFQFQLGNSF